MLGTSMLCLPTPDMRNHMKVRWTVDARKRNHLTQPFIMYSPSLLDTSTILALIFITAQAVVGSVALI
jgi:hypothetical protein